jgi:uncharacterized membrane protein YqiK
MLFQRLLSLSLVPAALPLLAACNQTAAPATPGVIGSGAIAAITEAQSAQARHRVTSFVLNQAAGQDPTGLSGIGVQLIEEEQERIEEENERRIDIESAKALAEAEAWQAQSEMLERQKASGSRQSARRRTAP